MKAAQPGDTIVFSTLFNLPQTIAIGTALPDINSDLTITGPGANLLTVRANDGGNYTISLINSGTVNVSGLTFANGTGASGGAIKNAGSLTLTNVVLTGNGSPTSQGGAIQNIGTLNIMGSTLEGNTALFGGAIFSGTQGSFVGTVTLTASTLSGNSATASGSAIVNDNFGGSTPIVALVNCTVADNIGPVAIADYDQGGSASVTTQNTIFSNNGTTFATSGSGAHIVSLGNNLDSTTGGGFLGASGDLTNTDPRLLPLDYYGGLTQTYLLQLSSPAVNAGANVGASAFDQRGVARPQNGVADIGAVELRPLVVFSTADTTGAFCDSNCTLREAITQANADDAVVDDIFFSGAVFNAPQTINLSGSLPNITGDLTINGPGANLLTVRRDTGGNYGILEIENGVVALMSGVTLSNGHSGNGGALSNFGTFGIVDSVLSGNTADQNGGALQNNGRLTLRGSTVAGNTAEFCGGPFNYSTSTGGGNMFLVNSTIAGNAGQFVAGGILSVNFGGPPAVVSVINSTVANNAQVSGVSVNASDQGGIATITLLNTIVAESSTGTTLVAGGGNGAIVSGGNNLASDGGGGFLTGTGDLTNTNPLLGTLSNYGGTTPTLYPKSKSPAIDAANDSAAPSVDQRGVSRPQGPHPDIGAVEANGELIFQNGFDG
jgi:CSLREA domain-containing protein